MPTEKILGYSGCISEVIVVSNVSYTKECNFMFVLCHNDFKNAATVKKYFI